MQLAKSTGGESHVHTCQGLGHGELPNGHLARPSPVVNTLVRKREWVLEILHQALGVRPGWPHGVRVLAIEYPIGWSVGLAALTTFCNAAKLPIAMAVFPMKLRRVNSLIIIAPEGCEFVFWI